MERNLTLLVRLFVVAFVGFCVWLVLDSMSGQLASKLFNRDSPVADHQPAADSPAPSHVLPFIGGIVAMIAVAWGIEAFFFRRFEIAVKQIRDLGGTVRFDTSADLSYLCYRFGTATVDLSNKQIDDGNFPPIRWIPRLKTLRACNTEIGDGALNEIAKCQSLRSLDLSGTNFTVSQLEILDGLDNLENLLLEDR